MTTCLHADIFVCKHSVMIACLHVYMFVCNILLRQVLCNNILCSTVDIYTEKGIKMQCKVLIIRGLQKVSL